MGLQLLLECFSDFGLVAWLADSSTDVNHEKIPAIVITAVISVMSIIADRVIRKKVKEQRIVVVRERRKAKAARIGDAFEDDEV